MKDFDDFLRSLDADEIEDELEEAIKRSKEEFGEAGDGVVIHQHLVSILRRYHLWANS